MSQEIRVKIKKASVVLTLLLTIPFLIITIARFSDSREGVIGQILIYGGQQIQNFNDGFNINTPISYGRSSFSKFISIFDFLGIMIPKGQSNENIRLYYIAEGVQPWVFKTFVGSFLSDFGKNGTIIFLLFLSLFTKLSLHRVYNNNEFHLSNLIFFILIVQIVLFGVFYFRQADSNYYIIVVLILSLLFKIKISNSKSIIIYKHEF
ncbi:hypothetical protein MASR2M69_19370 [Bacteroidota bacterium]